ncbi:helix-turn-helix transcriptional regulator [Amycolatopsis japonica]
MREDSAVMDARVGGFVGRAAELATLRDLVERAADGEANLVTVEGPPGSGKSMLIRQFVAERTREIVLHARADQSEIDYGYGVVEQLLARVDSGLLGKFPALRDVIEARGATFAIGEQLVLLLKELQSMAPVVIVIDDWQWSDQLSVRALGFVARRLWCERVLITLGVRYSAEALYPEQARLLGSVDRLTRIPVPPLSRGEVEALAVELGHTELPVRQLNEIHVRTGGHALYAYTLLLEDKVAWRGVSGEIAVPASLTSTIQHKLTAMPERSRALLEALAVLDDQVPLAQMAVLADVEDPVRYLQQPLNSGLLVWTPSEPTSPVRFRHAIQRDSVYQAMTPERRRQLHLRAVGLVGERAAWWHRVSAVDVVSASLAERLDDAAAREAAEGEVDLAATYLLWAAEVSGSREERERRTLMAVASFLTGRTPSRAERHREMVDSCHRSALKSAILGWYELRGGRYHTAEHHYRAILANGWAVEHGAAATLAAVGMAIIHGVRGEGRAAVEVCELVLAHETVNQQALQIARGCLAWGEAFQEGPAAGRRTLTQRKWLPSAPQDAGRADALALTFRGMFNLFAGDLAAAESDATMALSLSAHSVLPSDDELAHFTVAAAKFIAGNWQQAAVYVERATEIASTEGKAWCGAPCKALAAGIYAMRGNWALAEAELVRLRRCAQQSGPGQYVAFLATAEAVLAHARCDHVAIREALRPLIEWPDLGSGWPLILRGWWWPLHVESLIETGSLIEAEAALLAFDERVREDVPSLPVVAARLAGLLQCRRGDLKDAERTWRDALSGTEEESVNPLQLALLEQEYGRLLRTLGRRQAGTEVLRRARDRFASLGDSPFLARCDVELDDSGCVGVNRRNRKPSELTAREQEVADRVGLGMTNPEIANDLFVSAKTIEYHLSNIYSRLGLRNRRQLRDHVRELQAAADS